MTEATPLASEQITQPDWSDDILFLRSEIDALFARTKGHSLRAKEWNDRGHAILDRIAALSASPAPSGQGVSGEVGYQLQMTNGAWTRVLVERSEAEEAVSNPANTITAMRPVYLAAPAPSCAPGEVERAARAMCVADGLDPDEHIIGGQATGFEDFGPLWQAEERSEGQLGLTNYKRLAAAALSPQGLDAKEGGDGQDRKFAFRNGQFVNRVSGEPIPHDEPIIIFRARDHHSIHVLREYLTMATDEHHRQAIRDRMAEFAAYAEAHPERMKEPGITHDVRLNDDATPSQRLDPATVERLRAAYDAVSDWPEKRGDPIAVGSAGFMDLLALRNIVAELLPALKSEQWQRIDTAPREGTVFLLAFRVRGEEAARVREARWEPGKPHPTSVNGFLIYDTGIAWMPMPALATDPHQHGGKGA